MVVVKVVEVTIYVPVSVWGYVPPDEQLSEVVTIVRLFPLIEEVPLPVHVGPEVITAVYVQVPLLLITRVKV